MHQISKIYFVTKHVEFRDKINFGYLVHIVGYLYGVSHMCITMYGSQKVKKNGGANFWRKCNAR
jgi:hypothetical protein